MCDPPSFRSRSTRSHPSKRSHQSGSTLDCARTGGSDQGAHRFLCNLMRPTRLRARTLFFHPLLWNTPVHHLQVQAASQPHTLHPTCASHGSTGCDPPSVGFHRRVVLPRFPTGWWGELRYVLGRIRNWTRETTQPFLWTTVQNHSRGPQRTVSEVMQSPRRRGEESGRDGGGGWDGNARDSSEPVLGRTKARAARQEWRRSSSARSLRSSAERHGTRARKKRFRRRSRRRRRARPRLLPLRNTSWKTRNWPLERGADASGRLPGER